MDERKKKDEFDVFSPDAIVSERGGVKYLLMRQLERTDWLMSFSMARCQTLYQRKCCLLGIYSALSSLENLLSPVLDSKYHKEAIPILEELDSDVSILTAKGRVRRSLLDCNTDRFHSLLNGWHALLIQNLQSVGLLPSRRREFQFEDDQQ